jgi:hypothetical protein
MTANIDQQSDPQGLVPFTGYYALDGGDDMFVMVDTNATCVVSAGQPATSYGATITISPDGIISTRYTLGPNCSFDGSTLTITDLGGALVAQLSFDNSASPSRLAGTLHGKAVTGKSPFGPVQLSLWSGTYYLQLPKQSGEEYIYVPSLQINPDGTISYTDGTTPIQPIKNYWYDYGMFVIELQTKDGIVIWEMGTTTGWGRVAGNASDGQMLVSIQLQEQAPHL